MRLLLLAVSCSLLAACQSAPKPEPAGAVATAPAPTPIVVATLPSPTWVRTEIVFTLAPAEAEGMGLAIAEGEWRKFVDEEVTPRFPDGVSVIDGTSQWRADTTTPIERDRTKVLALMHAGSDEALEKVAALLAAFERRFPDQGFRAVEYPLTSTKVRASLR